MFAVLKQWENREQSQAEGEPKLLDFSQWWTDEPGDCDSGTSWRDNSFTDYASFVAGIHEENNAELLTVIDITAMGEAQLEMDDAMTAKLAGIAHSIAHGCDKAHIYAGALAMSLLHPEMTYVSIQPRRDEITQAPAQEQIKEFTSFDHAYIFAKQGDYYFIYQNGREL